MRALADLVAQVRNEEDKIREGGGTKAIENQHSKTRLTARERIHLLADPGTFFELGAYAAHGMYEEWGGAPAAGVVTGLARIHTRLVMLIVNDATVKAGAFFPMTAKKVIRAQNITRSKNRIPTVYLVEFAAGVFLPLQEDVSPTPTISAAYSATTPSCRQWHSSDCAIMACAWRAADICP
jgi:acetyl-CoA carboxylase carboxyltransferase component